MSDDGWNIRVFSPQQVLRAAVDVGRRESGRPDLAEGEEPNGWEVHQAWKRVQNCRTGAEVARYVTDKYPDLARVLTAGLPTAGVFDPQPASSGLVSADGDDGRGGGSPDPEPLPTVTRAEGNAAVATA